MSPHKRQAGLTRGLLVLILFSAFSFAAIVRVATADHYHTNCVDHGFVHGESTTDGSFFGRVDAGCGSTFRTCDLYTYGNLIGSMSVSGTSTTCNNWSLSYGSYTECASTTHTSSSGVFSSHVHKAHNWCG